MDSIYHQEVALLVQLELHYVNQQQQQHCVLIPTIQLNKEGTLLHAQLAQPQIM